MRYSAPLSRLNPLSYLLDGHVLRTALSLNAVVIYLYLLSDIPMLQCQDRSTPSSDLKEGTFPHVNSAHDSCDLNKAVNERSYSKKYIRNVRSNRGITIFSNNHCLLLII